jgi:NAD(P) transhydrogenase subunit beta
MSHACGALAAALVGTAEFYSANQAHEILPTFVMVPLMIETLLGFLTFTGSLMAMGKLQEVLPQRPITYRGQNLTNFTLFGIAAALAVWIIINPTETWIFPVFAGLSLVFGVLLIIPIGGADMPTVIALLNSYAGLSACAMGFVLGNKMLVIAGALDGSSGLILSIIMCKAMNRSFTNVLFGAFGQLQVAHGHAEKRPVRSASPEEAASILDASSTVIIVPGYGLAVAQAQHKIRELFDALMKRGVDVKFGIHPVAGRMPGHMNVLLAEADIPYDRLIEMDEINGEFPQCDVALIIGANDVTNPAARTDKTSPIYGMPILDVDKAHTVMVIKRSMSPGFAGIDNPLYYMDKTLAVRRRQGVRERDPQGAAGEGGSVASAASRSASRSSRSSIPTEMRMRSGVIPIRSSASGGTEACVMVTGCSISDSTPPSDSATVKRWTFSSIWNTASWPPFRRNEKVPP